MTIQLALDKVTGDLIKGEQPVELMPNPNFVDNIDGWELDQPTDDTIEWDPTPLEPGLGGSMKMTNGVDRGLAQFLVPASTFEDGAKYKLKADVIFPAGGVVNCYVKVRPLNSTTRHLESFITASPTQATVEGSFIWTEDMGDTYMQLQTNSTLHVTYWDNVSLAKLEEGFGGVLRTEEARFTVQQVRSKLRTILGEWALDQSVGWLEISDFERNPDLRSIETRARIIILGTEGVLSINSMNSSIVGRQVFLTFEASTIYGEFDLTVPWGIQ